MSTFKDVVAARVAIPPRIVTLPLSAWQTGYQDKPAGDVEVGIRLYSQADAAQARAAASQYALRFHPQEADEDARNEAYNGALMAWLVARSVCDPVDVAITFFGENGLGADEDVACKLTPKGVEFLFEELDALMYETSPTMPPADDDDLAWLATALSSGEVWRTLDVEQVRRVRRQLARAIAGMGGGAS